MFRSRVLVSLFAMWIGMIAAAMAQTIENNATNVGQDFFTADQDGVGQYMRIVTGAHVNTVKGWIQQGRIDNAIADLKYTLDRFPNHPQALNLLAIVAQLGKTHSLAIAYFEKAVRQFPQYALTQAQYGLFLVSIGNVDAGIERLNQSTAKDPKLAAGHAGLANAYARKGDMTNARESAAKARELGFTGQLAPGL